MRPVSRFSIALIAILLPETWSLPDPTCYEPKSGHGPALRERACMKTASALIIDYPSEFYVIHSPPSNPNFVECPLDIERDGCLFTMDYFSPTNTLHVSRRIILEAILTIQSHCIGRDKNFDGGEIWEIWESGPDEIFIRYSLQHPEPRLTGMNTSSADDSPPNENLVVPTYLNASLSRSGDINSSSIASEK